MQTLVNYSNENVHFPSISLFGLARVQITGVRGATVLATMNSLTAHHHITQCSLCAIVQKLLGMKIVWNAQHYQDTR